MQFRSDSRYALSRLYTATAAGALTPQWGQRKRLQLRQDDECVNYSVGEGEKLEQVAQTKLGNCYLWWVLADINDIAEPWADLANVVIKIPTVATLNRIFDRAANGEAV
jgi:hypothetical protein